MGPEKKQNIFSIIKVGILELVIVTIFSAVFLAILNFFNIFQLSTTYPQFLGFLPHLSTTSNQTIQNINPTSASENSLPLPLTLKDPWMYSIVISYGMIGKIEELRQLEGKKYLIRFDFQKNYPQLGSLILNNRIDALYQTATLQKDAYANIAPANFNDFQVGDKVGVALDYVVKQKRWDITLLRKIIDETQSSTQSQTQPNN